MNPLHAILLMMFSGAVLFASTTTYKSAESLIISENDSLQGDLFYGGRYLEIEGRSFGDVIVASQKTVVSGSVSDDLYAWCEEVRLEGEVGDMFLGFAKEITIKGTVHGDVIAYGGSVHILKGAQILGNLYAGTGYLHIDQAYIAGKVKGGAGKIYLNGTIDQSIDLSANDIRFGEDFTGRSDVRLTLNKEPEQPLNNAPDNLEIKIEPLKRFFTSFSFYWFFLSGLVIGFILLVLAPVLFENLTTLAKDKLPAIAGSGVLFLILTPVAAIFAIIFLPLTFILTALFLILVYLSKIFTAYIASDYVFKKIRPGKSVNRFLIFFSGFVLLTLVLQIPFIGFVAWLTAVIIGSGAVVYHILMIRKNRTSNAA